MSNRKKLFNCLGLAVLILVSLFGVYKTVYLSADIDESYAVTLGMRIANGERMFRDMWEIHQTSAVLYAPLIALYKLITGGVEGLLIFLRIIGVLIQGGVSLYAFCVLRKMVNPYIALYISFIYFNFTPKHMQSPEFTQYLYWGMMVLCLSLVQFLVYRKCRYLLITGLALCVCILAYPFAILLFPVLIFMFVRSFRLDERGLLQRTIAVFSATCVAGGTAFLIFVLSGVSIWELFDNIPYVFMDESHSQSLLLKFKEHFISIWDMSKITVLIIFLTHMSRIWCEKKYKQDSRTILTFAFMAEAVYFIVQFHTIYKVNFTVFLPLILQIFLLLLYVYAAHQKVDKSDNYEIGDTISSVNAGNVQENNRLLFQAMVIPSLFFCLTVLIASNLTANYSTGFLIPAVCGLIAIVGNLDLLYDNEKELGVERKVSGKLLIRCGFIAFVSIFMLLLVTNRIFLVRFTSTQRKNIFEGYYETNHGVLKGIKLGDMDYRQYEAKTAVLREQVTEEDVFLYVGCDMFLYSLCEGEIGTGNTISTPAFGEQLLTYYEKYPDKIPTVMFVDREYVADFGTVLQNEPFKSFVEQNYQLDMDVVNVPVNVYRLISKGN